MTDKELLDEFDFYRSFTLEEVEKIQTSDVGRMFKRIYVPQGCTYLWLSRLNPTALTEGEIIKQVVTIISSVLGELVNAGSWTTRKTPDGKLKGLSIAIKFGPQEPIEHLLNPTGTWRKMNKWIEDDDPTTAADWWKK